MMSEHDFRIIEHNCEYEAYMGGTSLPTPKRRLKALLYIVGPITGETLYNLAADEIECLRAQVEDHIANALARANKQAIMVEALKHIREMSIYHTDREIATKVLVDVGELQP